MWVACFTVTLVCLSGIYTFTLFIPVRHGSSSQRTSISLCWYLCQWHVCRRLSTCRRHPYFSNHTIFPGDSSVHCVKVHKRKLTPRSVRLLCLGNLLRNLKTEASSQHPSEGRSEMSGLQVEGKPVIPISNTRTYSKIKESFLRVWQCICLSRQPESTFLFLYLYQLCVLPILLYGVENWINSSVSLQKLPFKGRYM